MSGSKSELELVEQYLNEHFNSIRKLLGHRIPDHEMRAIALRRCTRHVSPWQQDLEQAVEAVGPDHPNDGEPVQPTHEASGSGRQSREEAYEVAKAKTPYEWSTGDEQATDKQLAVLRHRGIAHTAGISKGEASKLITQNVYNGRERA